MRLMTEVFHRRKQKAAASLFWAFNGFGAFLWILGIVLTIEAFTQADPNPLTSPIFGSSKFFAEAQAKAEQTLAFARLLTGTSLFVGYAATGLLSLFLAQAIRYLASIAEKVGGPAE